MTAKKDATVITRVKDEISFEREQDTADTA